MRLNLTEASYGKFSRDGIPYTGPHPGEFPSPRP